MSSEYKVCLRVATRGICPFWKNNCCHYGKRCWMKHPKPCTRWLQGKCNNVNCKKSHKNRYWEPVKSS